MITIPLTARDVLEAHRDGVLRRDETRRLLGVENSETGRMAAEIAALRLHIVEADEAHDAEVATMTTQLRPRVRPRLGRRPAVPRAPGDVPASRRSRASPERSPQGMARSPPPCRPPPQESTG